MVRIMQHHLKTIFLMRLGEKLSISTQRALRERRGSTRVREDSAVSAEMKKAKSRSFERRVSGSHAICGSSMNFILHLLRCIRVVSLSKQGLAESSRIQSFLQLHQLFCGLSCYYSSSKRLTNT
jgi:hypothetical protein